MNKKVKLLLVIVCFCIVVCISVVGCGKSQKVVSHSIPTIDDGGKSVSDTKQGQGFTVTLQASPKVVKVGEKVALLLKVDGSREGAYFPTPNCQKFNMSIIDDQGKVVWTAKLKNEGMADLQMIVPVEGHFSATYTEYWTAEASEQNTLKITGNSILAKEVKPQVTIKVVTKEVQEE